jgi:hypothetical protein
MLGPDGTERNLLFTGRLNLGGFEIFGGFINSYFGILS